MEVGRGVVGEGWRLLEGVLCFAAVGGVAGDGPGTDSFGDEGLDELAAAGVAEERLVAEEKEGGDGVALGQGGEEFFVGGAGERGELFYWFWGGGGRTAAKG